MSLPVVSDSLQNYLAEVSRYPVLSAEDEREVAERYYRLRSVEDAHTLVTSNLRYVVKIALEYRHYGCRLADLIQEGNIGLMVAVKKFDPYKGFRLITYATWWIRAHIQDFILKTRGLVRHGTRALKKKLFYKNDASADNVADALVEGGGATTALAVREEAPVPDPALYDLSLDAAIGDDKTTFLDMLPDLGPGQEEVVSEGEETALVKKEISDAMALLNEKERLVIEDRVMSDEPISLQGLGDRLGVTRERVRQIEIQALKKLHKALKSSDVTRTVLQALPEPSK